jgi:hypothetical protein
VKHLLSERRAKEEKLVKVKKELDALIVFDNKSLAGKHLIETKLKGSYHSCKRRYEPFASIVKWDLSHLSLKDRL